MYNFNLTVMEASAKFVLDASPALIRDYNQALIDYFFERLPEGYRLASPRQASQRGVYLVASKSAAAVIQNHYIKRCETSGSWSRCVRGKSESHPICSIRPKISIDSLSSWRRPRRRQDMSAIDERLETLGIFLPDVMPPIVDGYVPAFALFIRSGDHIPSRQALRHG